MEKVKCKENPKITTFDDDMNNGYLIPIISIHERAILNGHFPEQVYLTTILPNQKKGPHLHKIRTGLFTCIKGNIKVITKADGTYEEFYSGEDYKYQSILVPTHVGALLVNIGQDEALVLNMPCPAWTAEMNDEYTDDFSDCELI